MPTYEYRCSACGKEFEEFQSITAPVMRKCPKCGKLKLERLIGTGSGVIFKGGGFYQTDYRSEGYKTAAEADKKAAEPTSEGKDKKTEVKDQKSEVSETKPVAQSERNPARSTKSKRKK
jgi:putative FmdB family regulatory protein